MKLWKKLNKPQIALAIYLLLYQTEYFWTRYLDGIDIFLMLSYFFLGATLGLYWLVVMLKTISVWSKSRKGIITQWGFLLLLTLPLIFPSGLVNFEWFKSPSKWMAYREGVANCTLRYLFRENQSFELREVCFGTSHTKGNYRQSGDTLFLNYSYKDAPMDTLIINFRELPEASAKLLRSDASMDFVLYERVD